MSVTLAVTTSNKAVLMTDALFWDDRGVPCRFASKVLAISGLSRAVVSSRGTDLAFSAFAEASRDRRRQLGRQFDHWEDFVSQLPFIWRNFDAALAAEGQDTLVTEVTLCGWSDRQNKPVVLQRRTKVGLPGFPAGATAIMAAGYSSRAGLDAWADFLPPAEDFDPLVHGVAVFEASRGVLRDISAGLIPGAPRAHTVGGWIDVTTITAQGVDFQAGIKVWPDVVGQPIKPSFIDVFHAQQELYKAHRAAIDSIVPSVAA